MNPLEGFIRAEMALFLLECARVGGVIAIAPMSWTNAPMRVKVVLVLLLAFVVHGTEQRVVLPTSMFEIGYQLGCEVIVGVAMGFVIRIAVAMAEICGEIIAPAMGLGIATAFDPTTQAPTSVISTILRNLTILVALLIGIHRVLLQGLLASFHVLPVGQAGPPGMLLPMFVKLSSLAIAGGVRIALPLVAVLFMTQLALAFIARAAPQMQIFNVGFAVLLGVGLVLIAVLLPDFTRGFAAELLQCGVRLEELLMSLGAVS